MILHAKMKCIRGLPFQRRTIVLVNPSAKLSSHQISKKNIPFTNEFSLYKLAFNVRNGVQTTIEVSASNK
ncbi:hypothetical protein PPL_00249 [Heterostelium album PN500]|uniref:Uncharacterized protein n=1 Tax=Heterostelium pallidum (strain ATCC 26659 / Pp 5 / PN500) TaxID=670386 RepID=D3AVY3_HETP5|nr:hypothetical protein PPL_00249 [Heterostelium album PN500]EFA86456.1 hypothetical protein PPL_00249 [Heterostelium album PN500]|eukprot:XP_020438561.1 hypothetical protein PPL_00249 [Heterostelium album PN500]